MVASRAGPRFTGELHCTILPDGRLVRTDAAFGFVDKYGVLWAAQPGLISDGATIPRAVWPLIGGPFEGRHRRAAILHDAAYASQKKTREECDAMLYEAMRCDGEAFADAQVIYRAVRLFGWISWREDARRKEATNG